MREFVLKLAREAIKNHVRTGRKIALPDDFPQELKQKRGVFVTIYKNGSLRGCVGLPYPDLPLIEGLIEASVQACRDPRFEALKPEELNNILIEISLLTEPELVQVKSPKEYLEKIKIGKHGLIIRKGLYGGLFLPKVPVEQNWNKEDYLENLCYKAGLTGDSWLDSNSRLFKFEAQVFEEKL